MSSTAADKSAHAAQEPITVRIKELDLDLIQPNTRTYRTPSQGGSKVFIIGKPGQGKSTLIRDILFHKCRIFPTGIVMSGTEDSNSFFGKIFPDLFVYPNYDEGVIKDFIVRQKMALKQTPNPWSILLLDDCADDTRVFRQPTQQALMKNGRHWKMLYILSLQYALDVPPVIRTLVDGTFILRETSRATRKKLWENYASCIDNFEDFCTLMDALTNDYSALYIHNAIQSNSIEDCVFWYKADPSKIPSNFRVGCDEFHAWSEQRRDPTYEYSM